MVRGPRIRPRREPPADFGSPHPSLRGWIERDEPIRAPRRADVIEDAHDAVQVRDEHHVLDQEHTQRAHLPMPPRTRIRPKRLEHRARHSGVNLGRVVDHARGSQAAHHRADVRGEMPGLRGGDAASERRIRRDDAGDHGEDVRRRLAEIGRPARVVGSPHRAHRARRRAKGPTPSASTTATTAARHRVRIVRGRSVVSIVLTIG